MKDLNVVYQVPDHLTINGVPTDIPPIVYHIGQPVYILDENNSHPIDLLPRRVVSVQLFYTVNQQNFTDLKSEPTWFYELRDDKGLILQTKYTQAEIISEQERLELLQDAINDGGITLDEAIYLFYKYDLEIKKEDILGMWKYLEDKRIDFPYYDLKAAAKIYFEAHPSITLRA